jgi:maltoporin
VDTWVACPLKLKLLFTNPLTKKHTREMDSPVFLPGIRGLKITLVAGLALLTTDALFAQSTDQSGVDSLKTQMNQMQRQYEQRIEAMEAKMKALESNASGGSILNTHVLTDADGKAVAPAPMLDESFLKSLTRNFTFSVYIRTGVGSNGNGGPQDFDFQIPDFGLGRFRLGNEPDTYMELTWKQAHLLGDSPDVMDVAMTFTERISYQTTKTTNVSQFDSGAQFALRQAYLEAKNFIKCAPEITVWAGQRFYDRHDIHLHDLFFDDYSGYGLGFDNIDLGFGKLAIAYLGGFRDGLDNGNTTTAETTVIDPHQSGLNLSTLDVRIHDINLLGGQLELLGDYQFFKGGHFAINNGNNGSLPTIPPNATPLPLNAGDASGFRVGFIYYHPICATGANFYNTSFWQISAQYGYGASELFGTDPNNQRGTLAGYNLNANLERINSDGTISSSSLDRASQFRATGQMVWNVNPCFAIAAEVHYRYDDQGAISAETVNAVTGLSAPISSAGSTVRTTGGSSWVLGGGIRPVVWLNDWFALQGQAGIDYVSRNRAGGQALNPNGSLRNDSFGNSGALGVFTFAPTIKPRGNWWTRPEFRAFLTYAIWAKALEGSIGNDGGGNAPYRNAREGWVVGVQTEWFF